MHVFRLDSFSAPIPSDPYIHSSTIPWFVRRTAEGLRLPDP